MLGLALGLLLIVTIAAGLGNIFRVRAPELALRLSPWNAQAAGRLSQRLLLSDSKERERAVGLANQALRRDATIVSAVVTQGALDDVGRRAGASLDRFTYARLLSRRNLPTELWWIEYAVSKGDIAQALRHYDTALRAIKQAPDILFPVLGDAISQAGVRKALLPILSRDPVWKDRFLQWLVNNGANNRAAVGLFADMRGAGRLPDPAIVGKLEQILVEERDYDTAWMSYRSRHPLAQRDTTRDDHFASAGIGKSPFDWNVVDEQGAASISRSDGGHVLMFATMPATAGTLVRQFQLLPPGRYELSDDFQGERDAASPRPYWALHCVGGPELGRIPIGGVHRAAFMVPADCPAQWLVLSVDAGDAIQGLTGTVRSVSLSRKQAR